MVVAGHVAYEKPWETFDDFGEYIGLFRWTKKDGFTLFFEDTDDPVMEYRATELNYDGTVVGFYHDWFNMGGYWYTSFRYTDEYGLEFLIGPELDWNYHLASDISADGSMVVGWYGAKNQPWEGIFIWNASGDPTVVPPPEDCSFNGWDAPVVSGDGRTVIANCRDTISDSASFFKWTETDGYALLGNGISEDISTDGKIVVGLTDSDGGAFRYSEVGGMEEIGAFTPVKTNGDGSVILGDDRIWNQENGLQSAKDYLTQKGIDLDSDGWIIASVKDISDDGNVIVGTGTNNSTSQESPWIAILTPTPPETTAIVDNADSRFSAAGSWHLSDKAIGFYGTDYAYAYGDDGSSTATFTFQIPADGDYTISAQWPAHSSRTPDAPFTLTNNGQVVDTVRVDQRTDGGIFNPLTGSRAMGAGVYALRAGVLEVTLSNDADGALIDPDGIDSLPVVGQREGRIRGPGTVRGPHGGYGVVSIGRNLKGKGGC